MHIGVNNLPKVVTQRCSEQELNPRAKTCWSQIQHCASCVTYKVGRDRDFKFGR